MASAVDALSDVLRMVHLKACVYFVKDMPLPWGMDIPAVAHGPLHVVLEGSCVLVACGKHVTLNVGDAVLLPRGPQHQMLNAADTVPEALACHRLAALRKKQIAGGGFLKFRSSTTCVLINPINGHIAHRHQTLLSPLAPHSDNPLLQIDLVNRQCDKFRYA